MSPSQGRFLGRDPKKEQGGLNLYGFVLNNPVNLWDYLGMLPPAGSMPGMAPFGFGPVSGPSMYGQPNMPSYSVPSVNFSFGVGSGGSATVAPTAVGAHAEVSIATGVFATSGPALIGVSAGEVRSAGATLGPLGMVNQNNLPGPGGAPPQSSALTLNPAIGLAAGGAPFAWISNAGSTDQLSNISITYNFNIGIPIVGPKAGFGVSLGTGPGVWSLAVTPPTTPSVGGGIELTMTPSTTTGTTTFASLSANPYPTQAFGSTGSVFMNPNYQSTTMSASQAAGISTTNVVSISVSATGQVTIVTNGSPQQADKKGEGGDDSGTTVPDVPVLDDTSTAR